MGTAGNRAAKAVKRAAESGFEPLHINMRFLKPLDTSMVDYACGKCGTIITVEDGALLGGLGSAVSEYVASVHPGIKVISLGIPDKFVEQGTVDELISECGYNVDNIYDSIIAAK